MKGELEDLERMQAGEPIPVERPWISRSDRIACFGFLAIIVTGGPIQLWYAPHWWHRILPVILMLDLGWRSGMTAFTRRDYFRFPYRRPVVAPTDLVAWRARLERKAPQA